MFALKFMSVAVPIFILLLLIVEKYKTDDNFAEIVLSFVEFLMIYLIVVPIVLLVSIGEYLKGKFKEYKKSLNTKKEVHYGK